MKTTMICGKCDGTGHIAAFRHIENGACFDCGATGRVEVKATTGTSTASEMTAERALSTLRIRYAAAKEHGRCWFADATTTGLGMPHVLSLAAFLDDAKRAQVVAAFEALNA